MKHLNKTKSFFLALGLACFTSFFITCKNPTENIVVTVKADFVTAASLFNVADATTGEWNPALEGTSVKITGPAAAIVYNSGGSHNIKMTSGVFSISFAKGTTASKDNPLNFNIEISASGYQPIIYPVSLTSITPTIQNIYLVNTSNLPKGAAKVSGSATIDNTNVTTDITTIEVPTSANKNEKATITIPKGIKMFDADGNALTGNVSIDVIHISPTSAGAINALGKNLDNTIKDKNGNVLPQTGLAFGGSLQIEMKVGDKTVKSFDKPISARIEFSNNIFNPRKGEDYKEGHIISILSQNNGSSFWVKENSITIAKDANGKLYGDFEIAHLSTWVAANEVLPYNLYTSIRMPTLKTTSFYDIRGSITIKYLSGTDSITSSFSASVFKVENGVLKIINSYVPNRGLCRITNFYITVTEEIQRYVPIEPIIIKSDFIEVEKPIDFGGEPEGGDIPILLPPLEPERIVTLYAYGKCNNGKIILSPNGQIVKYMKLIDWSSTTAFSSAAWKTKEIHLSTGGSYNKVYLNENEFVVGTTYKFATEYDGIIRYKDYTVPANYSLGEMGFPLEISVGNSCP